MRKKPANKLAEFHELGYSQEDFFEYIVTSYVNGQKSQCKSLFEEMLLRDQLYFLTEYWEMADRSRLFNRDTLSEIRTLFIKHNYEKVMKW